MRRIVLAILFIGIVSVNSSYSMLNKSNHVESSFVLNILKDYLCEKFNLSNKDDDFLEEAFKEEGLFEEFSYAVKNGLFFKDPLTWKWNL